MHTGQGALAIASAPAEPLRSGEHARILPEVQPLTDERGARALGTTLRGAAVLRHPRLARGAAFTFEERRALGLDGLLPSALTTLEEQMERALHTVRLAGSPLAQHQALRALQDRDEVLYFATLGANLEELLPLVYTPTVGAAVIEYDRLLQAPRGLVISADDVGRIDELLDAWPEPDVRLVVATDASAILGLGDRGHGGIGIAIGKLALYSTLGVAPEHTLPVLLDVGTDREGLLNDPLYQGVRRPRLRGADYDALIDAFVEALARRFPRALLQWEDFAKDTAFSVLARNRARIASFNDDIQGTGAVALAGLLSACARKGERLRDQRVVVHGAGAGGAGVARALRAGMMQEGASATEARARVLVLDSGGLLLENGPMEPYKRELAQPPGNLVGWRFEGVRPTLLETVRESGATALLGLSGQHGAFDQPIIEALSRHTARPVVLALSNPTSACEAIPEDVLRWTQGRALVATGSPFAPVVYGGRTHTIGQGNNAFIFPGLGLGALLCGAREVSDTMVLEAAYALADYVADTSAPGEADPSAPIYPSTSALREVTIRVAARVMRQAAREWLGALPDEAGEDLDAFVEQSMWKARYLPVHAL